MVNGLISSMDLWKLEILANYAENACEPSARVENENRQDTSTNEEEVGSSDDDDASTISNVGDSSGKVWNNRKRFSVKKPATETTEQVAKNSWTTSNYDRKWPHQRTCANFKGRYEALQRTENEVLSVDVWPVSTQWRSKYATSWQS